jgi:S1-C subfamily serine protease
MSRASPSPPRIRKPPGLLAVAAAVLSLSGCSAGAGLRFEDLSAALAPPAGALSAMTGTGFFVSFDGTLLTAKHVVDQCLRIDILSEAVAPTTVWKVASYDRLDLALLRVEGAFSTPSALRMTRKPVPDASAHLKVYGYPGDAGLRRAAGADTRLVNASVPEFVPERFGTAIVDPRFLVWVEGPLRYGYSGGPVVAEDGTVVGVMLGLLKKDQHYNIAIGAGLVSSLTRLASFVPPLAGPDMPAGGDDRAVRAAIVRVVCWRDTPLAADE